MADIAYYKGTIYISKHRSSFAVLVDFLIYVYFALTFFEPYLNGVIGSVTKYYILLLMFLIVVKDNFHITLHNCIVPYVIWLVYRFVTLLWTDNFAIFQMHIFSQIGMVGLLVVLTSHSYEKTIIENIAKVMWASSFAISLMAMFFADAYHGTVETRQVLVLFGQEADPNNQAAFALVGISIALYYIFFGKQYRGIAYITLFVNSISMFMTGSRGGIVSLLAIILFVIIFNGNNQSVTSLLAKMCFFAGVVILGFYVLKDYIPQNILRRLLVFEDYEGGTGRIVLWSNGLRLLVENLNFLFGAGWGEYYGYNGIENAMHNTYLAMLCDVGIAGFLLFFIPIIKKAQWCMKKREYLPIMLLMAGFFPSFFLDAINKRFFWNVIMFLFMYYFCESKSDNNENTGVSRKRIV